MVAISSKIVTKLQFFKRQLNTAELQQHCIGKQNNVLC